MQNRRTFLKAAGTGAIAFSGCLHKPQPTGKKWVNDVHSQLNRTRVAGIIRPEGPEEIQGILRRGRAISVCGGRHAMGGQQFGTDTWLVDTAGMDKVLHFDSDKGLLEVEAGIQWPDVLEYLDTRQRSAAKPWGFAQKQTGADKLSLGGALSANAHGRGLNFQPFVQDVESLRLINAGGEIVDCDRTRNTELFRLVIGGYGLFGMVYSLKLRLVPRQKVRRLVEVLHVRDLLPRLRKLMADGALYGDFQFNIDSTSPNFLQEGVFSCYEPAPMDTPMPENQRRLTSGAWKQLIYLAHRDKGEAYRQYAGHYRRTHGQVYWSDAHQMSWYEEGYHNALEQKTDIQKGTEMISEVYVPRDELTGFLAGTADEFRRSEADVIYGTVRFIRKDETTALPWAKQDYACIVLNLHVDHGPKGIPHARKDFRKLIDLALERDGSFFLTYHRWATRKQIEKAYPGFRDFMDSKKKWDPGERFQSDWHRHHRDLFA